MNIIEKFRENKLGEFFQKFIQIKNIISQSNYLIIFFSYTLSSSFFLVNFIEENVFLEPIEEREFE